MARLAYYQRFGETEYIHAVWLLPLSLIKARLRLDYRRPIKKAASTGRMPRFWTSVSVIAYLSPTNCEQSIRLRWSASRHTNESSSIR
jgi:hypothetical protein